MKSRSVFAILSIAAVLIIQAAVFAAVQTPVLKWKLGGCSSWCEIGWFSSPVIADVNNDGIPEIVAASYTVNVFKAQTGEKIQAFNSGNGRVWPGVITADINGDGHLEILYASGGSVTALLHDGSPYWSRQATTSELRGLAAADLNGSGKMQVLVTGAVTDSVNTWIYSYDGSAWTGWPQRSGTAGYSWGVYNCNAAIGNISGDSGAEIVVPSDVHYICAYGSGGTALAAASRFGGKVWGQVGVWADTAPENRGWGNCSGTAAESYRANFATGAATIADMDGDGTREVVVTGNVYDCSDVSYPSKYTGVFIFNADRTRFKRGSYDWTVPPVGSGAPISEDYNIIESCMPDPVVADIDGDGAREILFSAYDGKLHAFHLDKTEHGNWPFSVYHAGDPYLQFSSPPVVADLDNDGKAEVLFTAWTAKGSYKSGSLYILDYLGNVLQKVALPDTAGGTTWNGGIASPTIDKIGDSYGDYGIAIVSATGGVVVYTLPGTQEAKILWGTGRGNYLRNGYVPTSSGTVVEDRGTPGRAPLALAGSVLLDFGSSAARIALPFSIEKGFKADLFDISGRKIPCRTEGAKVSVRSSGHGLLIVRIRDAGGKNALMTKVVR
jgi:hypothetical protein